MPSPISFFSTEQMKRACEFPLAVVAILALAVPMLLLAILVKLTSTGPIIYWSDRVGRENRLFRMPKFRTMNLGTPTVATHLLAYPSSYLTPLGRWLRRTSLDETPQLWSVLRGEMSLVGPRPALFNQYDLIALRTSCGIHRLTPGITGWAQINGRDDLSIEEKVRIETEYLNRRSFWFDLRIMLMTPTRLLGARGVAH